MNGGHTIFSTTPAPDPPAPRVPALDALLHAAIARRAFPGAVVHITQNGHLRHAAAYGTTRYDDAGTRPVSLATVYDIASITKIFTATVALHLHDAGLLALDQPAAHYLPALRSQAVTVRHLLTHTSGLELRLSSLRAHAPADLRAAVYATEPSRPPGTQTAYVNSNTLILGDLVSQVAGLPLDRLLQQAVLGPLGLTTTRFCPPPAQRPHIPPTEWDHDWRGGLVQGTVHDESAHALGGVAGHAGLFSSAADLTRFAQCWLAGGTLGGQRILAPATAAEATRVQPMQLDMQAAAPVRCGLGWMRARPDIMGQAAASSYAHTGFTGSVLLVVPSQQITIVLLSNRTYPQRGPRDYLAVMAALVDATLAALA